ncbi:MAG: hypothetical protein V1874_05470 [Spirochaetota bacterium]
MKLRILTCHILLFLAAGILRVFAEQPANILLNDIIADINTYRNKTITLKLKLKNLDSVFDKITFYDKKNIDIIFDVSELKKDIRYQKQVLNLHEGLDYSVTFTVKELTEKNNLMGSLISFQPVILSNLPMPK